MRWRAIRPCLRARTTSRRPGASSIPYSRRTPESTHTSPALGGPARRSRSSPRPVAGTIRRRPHQAMTARGETVTPNPFDQLSINTIRTLSIDAVQQANSGHPGTPMALAPFVYTLWNRVLRFDPQDPIWPNRDRFVLSNGHASMLLWSVLHLSGVRAVNADYERLGQPAVSLDD